MGASVNAFTGRLAATTGLASVRSLPTAPAPPRLRSPFPDTAAVVGGDDDGDNPKPLLPPVEVVAAICVVPIGQTQLV
jgi:hypothetical protein